MPLRHSQLAPCSFQYISSTPDFTTEIQTDKVSVLKISVRLKLKPNEHNKSPSVDFQFAIVVQLESSVPRARSPLGVFHGRPPFDRRLRPRFPVASSKVGCDRRVPKRPRPGKFRPSATCAAQCHAAQCRAAQCRAAQF